MDTRDYSAKELEDDVPADAYVNVPCYKFLDSIESEAGSLICAGYPRCYKSVYGFHTGECPERSSHDVWAERAAESNLSLALGK